MTGLPHCPARPRPLLTPAVDGKGRDEGGRNVALAGLTVPDTALVRDAIELSRNSLEPYLFNHVMRSWLFGVVLSLGAKPAPDRCCQSHTLLEVEFARVPPDVVWG